MLDGPTHVLVADGAVARFLTRARPGARLVESEELGMAAEAAQPARDRPARVHDRFGVGRHGVESQMTPHEAGEAAFLSLAMDRTVELMRTSSKASLVLCAPPKALGLLGRLLPSDLRDRLVLTMDKDVTKETALQLDARLRELRV